MSIRETMWNSFESRFAEFGWSI